VSKVMNSEELGKLLEQETRHNQAVTELRIEHARFKMALESIASIKEPPYISAPGIAVTALNRGGVK
jgi:hypothetical protein